MKLNESDLLEKWLSDTSFVHWAKESDIEHVQQWETYFEQNPTYKELGELGRFTLLNLSIQPNLVTEAHSQAALERLKNSLENRRVTAKVITRVLPFYKRWQAAAAILLLVGLGFWGYLQTTNTSKSILVTTDFGETEQIILADDSKVILNANSTLSYDENQPRKVWLKGEAFFEVTRKPTTGENFQVFTNDLTVEVLGTIFNVKNRNNQTKVFLEEGKVVLAMEEQITNSIEMMPGELISYSKKQQKIIEQRTAKAIHNTSWKDGILRFEEAPLVEALAEISVIYGIKFDIKEGNINGQLFSGGVPTQNKNIMLATLKEVFGIEITQKGVNYVVRQK